MKKLLLLPLLLIGTLSFAQLNWHYVGSASGITATQADIEIGINGTLYLAYSDPASNSGKVTVKQWNNLTESWTSLGSIGYANATDIQIKTDGGDYPTVAAKVMNGATPIIEVYNWDGTQWNDQNSAKYKTNHSRDYSLSISENDVALLAYYNTNNFFPITNTFIVVNTGNSTQKGSNSFTGGNENKCISVIADGNDNPIVAWEHGDMSNYLDISSYNGTTWNTQYSGLGDFPVKAIAQSDNFYNQITTSWTEDYLTNKVYTQDYTISTTVLGSQDLVYSGGASGGYFDYDYVQSSNSLGDIFFIMDGTNSKLVMHYLSNTPAIISSVFADGATIPRLANNNGVYVISYISGGKVYVKETLDGIYNLSTLGTPFQMCEQSSLAIPAGNNLNYVYKRLDDFYDHSSMTVTYTSQNTSIIPNANLSSVINQSSQYIGMNVSGTNNVSSTTTIGIDAKIYFNGILFLTKTNAASIIIKTQPDISWNIPKLCTNDSPINISQNAIPTGGHWIIDGAPTALYNPAYCNCGVFQHNLSYYVTVNGCQNHKDTIITELFPPTFDVTTTPASCGVNDGSALVSNESGPAPLSYLWTTGSTTNSASNLSPGMYYVTVKDGEGCKRTKAAAIVSSTISITGVVSPVKCNGASTGAIDVTVTGGTGQLTYYWTHGAYTQDLTNLHAGPYELSVTDASGCMTTASFIVPENAPITPVFTAVQPSCNANDGSINSSVSGGTSPYNYLWKNSLGATIGTSPSISSLSAGGYTLFISDANLCIKTKIGMLNNTAGPIVTLDTIINADCSSNGLIDISISSANTIVSTIWSDNSTMEDLSAPAGEYSVAVTDDNGCVGHLIADINMNQLDPIQICMVTVDTNTITNLVLWVKPVSTDIDHFNIYRETSQVGLYQLIDSVLYTSLSSYNDLNASPSIRSWRYKVSAVNNCGIESELSDYHKTIHLSISQGLPGDYNLFWDSYEGFPYPNFELYRRTDLDGWQLIQTMPTNLFTYTDTPPSTAGLDYMISITSPNDCTPSKAQDYNSSRSNKANTIHKPQGQGGSTGIKTYQSNNFEMELYPNPTTGILNLVWEGNNTSYQILDLQGKLIQESTLNSGKTTIDLSSALPGIYFLQINGKTNKIIVQ